MWVKPVSSWKCDRASCGVGRCKALEATGILFLKFKSNNLSVPEKPSSIKDELFDTVRGCLVKSLVVEVSRT